MYMIWSYSPGSLPGPDRLQTSASHHHQRERALRSTYKVPAAHATHSLMLVTEQAPLCGSDAGHTELDGDKSTVRQLASAASELQQATDSLPFGHRAQPRLADDRTYTAQDVAKCCG